MGNSDNFNMDSVKNLFLFSLDNQKYAIELLAVDKVIPAIEIIHTPDDNEIFLGIINVYGNLIPVINIRKLLNIPSRDIDVEDFIVIVNSPFLCAFIVDRVHDVLIINEGDIIKSSDIHCDLKSTEGFVRLGNEVVFIHAIEKIISQLNLTYVGDNSLEKDASIQP